MAGLGQALHHVGRRLGIILDDEHAHEAATSSRN
jgi:hypothetical protein